MSERKTPIDMMLDSVEWRAVERTDEPDPDGLPYATHEGVLMIGDVPLRCYQLNTGHRVFDAEDVRAFFGGIFSNECQHEFEWIGGGNTPDGPIEPNHVCKHCGMVNQDD